MTVQVGGYSTIQAVWPYGAPYVTLTATSPSGVATDITASADAGVILSEEGTWTFDWTDDPGWLHHSADRYGVHTRDAI